MFRPNDGAGGNTNFLGPHLAGVHSVPPESPNMFDSFAKYKMFTPFIILYFTVIYLLSALRNGCMLVFNKGCDQLRKLYGSPVEKDKGMTNKRWYSYGDTYGSQHSNSPNMMNADASKGKVKEKSQNGSKKTEKKVPVLYGLLDEEQGSSLRIKSGQLYKGMNQFSNQRNSQLDEEYDDDDVSDDDSDVELEDDFYDDDYDIFDSDSEDYDPGISKAINKRRKRRVKKLIKKEVKKEVNKDVRTEVQNELKEFVKNEMKKKVLDELINQLNTKAMETTEENSETSKLALNLQLLQAILQDEIANRVQPNTHSNDLSQLNLQLIDAENKHTEIKNEQEQKVTQLEQVEEEMNQIQKQIENVKHKRNIYVHPNEEYRQLLFLYPQNKMFQEEEKTALLLELEKKYKIKVEEKENLLKQMKEMQNELQRASDDVDVLRASVKVMERKEKSNGKVNQPFGHHPPWVEAEEQVKPQVHTQTNADTKADAKADAKMEQYLPNIQDMLNLPQLSQTPPLTSLSTPWKGAPPLPSWVENLPEPVKMAVLADLQQKLKVMESKIHSEGDQIEQNVSCVY
ncbi:Uncharacterized protein PCOAH_00015490 [Plasmodium coatneyi]|uniref:Uncharacterized protein n=1 Tax=Plasmodium coatneyi TaxID=208452 RepID=A0A1B1DXQ4_9APIC|nr:Uncharacterized protein PCOAH_00015490 [Plasmodium coatneyi]ANQ07534.1 Uncharacterized protein PCOAH_00015490 [Plasmodium coatneyi]